MRKGQSAHYSLSANSSTQPQCLPHIQQLLGVIKQKDALIQQQSVMISNLIGTQQPQRLSNAVTYPPVIAAVLDNPYPSPSFHRQLQSAQSALLALARDAQVKIALLPTTDFTRSLNPPPPAFSIPTISQYARTVLASDVQLKIVLDEARSRSVPVDRWSDRAASAVLALAHSACLLDHTDCYVLLDNLYTKVESANPTAADFARSKRRMPDFETSAYVTGILQTEKGSRAFLIDTKSCVVAIFGDIRIGKLKEASHSGLISLTSSCSCPCYHRAPTTDSAA